VKTLPRNTILAGDARDVLAGLLPESIDCVVTSPPYANALRDYGSPGQLGQEPTITEYVENLRDVLRLVRRVLKDSGSLWLNLGDSYAKHPRQGAPRGSLLLAPQRVAMALAADGWIVRNIVVWHKPNPLPQSAPDRLSPTYEVVIFATKTRRYFFDLDAIRIPHRSAERARPMPRERSRRYQGNNTGLGKLKAAGRVGHARGKNLGDVWTIPTAVDQLGLQATFPEALIERPILASCPERICVQCDRAWTRPTRIVSKRTSEGMRHTREVGELRRCGCRAPVRAGVVLDCFMGTGTMAVVARRLRRDWLGIELNPTYVRLATDRLRAVDGSTAAGRVCTPFCPPPELPTNQGGAGRWQLP
jgi:site-specific DNA-methyltransferase (adenine-specific)